MHAFLFCVLTRYFVSSAYKSTEYQGESPADIANKAQSMAARGYTQAGVTAFNAADPKGTVHPMPEG